MITLPKTAHRAPEYFLIFTRGPPLGNVFQICSRVLRLALQMPPGPSLLLRLSWMDAKDAANSSFSSSIDDSRVFNRGSARLIWRHREIQVKDEESSSKFYELSFRTYFFERWCCCCRSPRWKLQDPVCSAFQHKQIRKHRFVAQAERIWRRKELHHDFSATLK